MAQIRLTLSQPYAFALDEERRQAQHILLTDMHRRRLALCSSGIKRWLKINIEEVKKILRLVNDSSK